VSHTRICVDLVLNVIKRGFIWGWGGNDCRCDERLKPQTKGSTRLVYTGLLGGLEHLKIETRLIDEMFVSVMGEYVFLK
jgi:hypothetical protein